MLSLNSYLLSDFFLNLFQGLEEELLYFRPLVEHNLRQSPYILELAILLPQILLQIEDVLLLLFDDLLMLELQELLLLLEIYNDLLERFLEDHDLLFEAFDLSLLLEASRFILLLGSLLDDDVSVHLFLFTFKTHFLAFVVLEGISLTHRFLGQLLILIMNTPFDLLNIPLRVLLRFRLEVGQLGFELVLLHLLHPCLLDLDSVSLFLDGLLQTITVLSPCHKLQIILELFLLGSVHLLELVGELGLLDHRVVDLRLVRLLDVLHLAFVVLHGICLFLFICGLQGFNLVLEEYHLLHGLIVVARELEDDLFLLLELLFVLGLQATDILCNL